QRVEKEGSPFENVGSLRQNSPSREGQTLFATASKAGAAPHEPPHFEPHDAQADRALLEALAGWCQWYSPLVGLEETDQPESLLLEITGCAPLFGGESSLAGQIVRDFGRAGLS